ncbi:hypothetical protein ES702_02019 [subsurface metagenome]
MTRPKTERNKLILELRTKGLAFRQIFEELRKGGYTGLATPDSVKMQFNRLVKTKRITRKPERKKAIKPEKQIPIKPESQKKIKVTFQIPEKLFVKIRDPRRKIISRRMIFLLGGNFFFSQSSIKRGSQTALGLPLWSFHNHRAGTKILAAS